MDAEKLLKQVDQCFAQGLGQEAERLLKAGIKTAGEEGDESGLLMLLNELMGYYRETSQVEVSCALAEEALKLTERMGLEGTIPYATTLLNIANVYRAGGRLEDSLCCYQRVREIYESGLAPEDMLFASLENNLSLLYQERGEFDQAYDCLLRALAIVERQDKAFFETAVTCANLAATSLELDRDEEAAAYSERSVRLFEQHGIEDAHYGAALSSLGTYFYKKRDYQSAGSYFKRAMEIMRRTLGENEYYHRLKENLAACERAVREQGCSGPVKGLALCRAYYETYGRAMIHDRFPDYENRIAVGLAGEGSDCFGLDDALSRDHDWGPSFCMWVTRSTYEEIGEALQKAYEELPREFMGFRLTESRQGAGRRGVCVIQDFYKRLTGAEKYEETDWREVSDAGLAAAVNGEVFKDEEGVFSALREAYRKGFPESVQYLKLAQSAAVFSQAGQYNYGRMCERGDKVSASVMLGDCCREALKLCCYLEGKYPPHDKWLFRTVRELPGYERIADILEQLAAGAPEISLTGELGGLLAHKLYEKGFISDTGSYLDDHTQELLVKSSLAGKTVQELAEEIAAVEFEAFDKVRNVGGRASCQNDWHTFSVMRKSQYLTWNRGMLMQYLYDFRRAYGQGYNLIEEKYGRMMESTAPEEYKRIKGLFPVLSSRKKALIESIVPIQVEWMEEFAGQYPGLAGNARSIRASEDHLYNTSYETYLRGEISAYSDKMLELYGRYLVSYARTGRNPVYDIMKNSVRMYGYEGLEEAERKYKND